MTAIKSGEGVVMEFKGPCNIYIQGRNLYELTKHIVSFAPKNKGIIGDGIKFGLGN